MNATANTPAKANLFVSEIVAQYPNSKEAKEIIKKAEDHPHSSIYAFLIERGSNGMLQYRNDTAGWYACSGPGCHMITFYFEDGREDNIKFYKNELSWAKRIVGILKRGF